MTFEQKDRLLENLNAARGIMELMMNSMNLQQHTVQITALTAYKAVTKSIQFLQDEDTEEDKQVFIREE